MSESSSAIQKIKIKAYFTGEKTKNKRECTGSLCKYYTVVVSTLLIIFSVVSITTFFQKEVDAVVASLTSTDALKDVEVATDEIPVIDNKALLPVASVAAPVTPPHFANPSYSYGYQPYDASFENKRQQPSVQNTLMSQHNARMEEMKKQRTAAFDRIKQERADRVKRREARYAKTQEIQIEAQKKMQQSFNQFHHI